VPTKQATTTAGTWVPEGFFGFLRSRGTWSLTDKGKAALAAANGNDSTQDQYILKGAPMAMHCPYPAPRCFRYSSHSARVGSHLSITIASNT
jgi:hypothetical protein